MREPSAQEMNDRGDTFKTHGIGIYFEGVKAVDGVDLVLNQGEILGLIGPNGAGKTTMVNLMTGALPATFGRVELEGVDVTGWTPARMAKKGVGRTFQNVRLFNTLTVLENVEMGAIGVGKGSKEARRLAWELLDWMNLADLAGAPAETLPYGKERRLGILRALATSPRFLLLDEPAAGLDESESDELMEDIIEIREVFGCGVMVIEHDMRLILRLCDRVHVLDYGKTISIGTPQQIQNDRAVIAAYLGVEEL
ncbi:MAG: ABC transporter ATP-binding protein [Pseudomonadota bacterium]